MLAISLGVKRPLLLLAAVTLFAWTGLGLLAWQSVAQRVTILSCDGAERPDGSGEVAVLGDRVAALQEDVRALAKATGEGLVNLHEELTTRQDEHATVLANRMDALRGEVASRTPSPSGDGLDDLLHEVAAIRVSLSAFSAETASAAASAVQSVPPSAEPEPPALATESAAEPAPPVLVVPPFAEPAAKPRKSFLAFTLPSDDLRFDERRSWSLLPGLSRLGFDAKTTLHDFTAATSAVEGELEVELAQPGFRPRAHLVVQARELDSGDDKRDTEMRERLGVEQHPTLEFELTRFVPAETDPTAMRAQGTAHGRMTIRGATHEVAMPVRLAIDEARRLTVEGEMKLDLERFGVPVPNKLGLITMQKEVQVWIALKFRALPRSEG